MEVRAGANIFWKVANIAMNPINRVLIVLVLLAVAAFCAFGFLTTFEPLDRTTQIIWRIVYGVGGLLCLAQALRLMWPRKEQVK